MKTLLSLNLSTGCLTGPLHVYYACGRLECSMEEKSSPHKKARLAACCEGAPEVQPRGSGLKPIITHFYHWVSLNTSLCKEVCAVQGFLLLSSPCPGGRPFHRVPMAECQPYRCHPVPGATASFQAPSSVSLARSLSFS